MSKIFFNLNWFERSTEKGPIPAVKAVQNNYFSILKKGLSKNTAIKTKPKPQNKTFEGKQTVPKVLWSTQAKTTFKPSKVNPSLWAKFWNNPAGFGDTQRLEPWSLMRWDSDSILIKTYFKPSSGAVSFKPTSTTRNWDKKNRNNFLFRNNSCSQSEIKI